LLGTDAGDLEPIAWAQVAALDERDAVDLGRLALVAGGRSAALAGRIDQHVQTPASVGSGQVEGDLLLGEHESVEPLLFHWLGHGVGHVGGGCARLAGERKGAEGVEAERLDEIEELLETLRSDLDSVGDATTCREKYIYLLQARGTIGEIGGHSEALRGTGGDDRDSRIADEFTRLDEWYGKIKDAFQRQCVR